MYFFKTTDQFTIDEGEKAAQRIPGAVLLDVRTPEEYGQGHLASAMLIPLDSLQNILIEIPEKSTPLLVYCRSGRRSGIAATRLGQLGYSQVRNIGGVLDYHGTLVK